LLVIGTTSEVGFLESVGMCDVFSVTYHVPKLKKEDARKVRNTITHLLSLESICKLANTMECSIQFYCFSLQI
jgi:hypothetical protein